jgi:hypothetical protein
MKFTLLVSALVLFLGSAVQAAPEPQLGGVLDSLTGGLLGGGGGASGGSGGSGGGGPEDFDDATTR